MTRSDPVDPVARRRPLTLWLMALGLVAGLLLPAAPLAAEDAPRGSEEEGEEAETEGEESPLQAIDKAEAKKLNDALKKAAKKKKAPQVFPAMEAIEDYDSPEFHKVLLKLLRHGSSLVAIRAAEMWEWRIHDKKCASKVWKASWMDKSNRKRFVVKAKVLKAFARGGQKLDAKKFKEVESDWRWIVGNPNPVNAPALSAIAEYFEITKDKRLCKRLAMELDEPMATNPNSPSNPPADWWERRWKLWKESKPAVVAALLAITGQEFDKTEEAKKWFQDNEKTFGFEW